MFEEIAIGERINFDGKCITVKTYDVELSDGHKSFREIIHHPGGVVAVAQKGSKILMVKQFRFAIGKVSLELPAGKLEKGENPDDAVKRELEEETGYIAKTWKSLGYINTTPGICDEKLYLYYANDLEFTKQHPDEGEILEFYEYELEELIEMIKDGRINDSKTICALTRAFL